MACLVSSRTRNYTPFTRAHSSYLLSDVTGNVISMSESNTVVSAYTKCIGTYNSIALTHRILLVCWVGLLVWLGFVCFFVHAFLDFLSPLLVCIFSYGKEVSDMERTLCRELLKAEVQESMNKCIGRCDITEMMKMKTAVNAADYNSSVNVCILPKPLVAFSLNFR